jgi:hypothetical protein
MADQQRMRISFKQTCDILGPYAKSKIMDQVKGMTLIIVYLVLFQTVVLGIGISEALVIAIGLGLVIFGLAFFLEGLMLGLMPLGEQCGVRLPQKLALPFLLLFSLILGFGATLAEPAIGVLKAAGTSVKAWNAPLLYLILNKHSLYLVFAVGGGVGIAVVFGMLRFLYHWSLKPFIFVIVPVLLAVSIAAYFNPNWGYVTGLAWDCGGVTTGPVTVPLVLALGIGVSRIIGSKKDSGVSGGFGVVTLASAFPILTVMLLGLLLIGKVPDPTSDVRFFAAANRDKVTEMFGSPEEMRGYAFTNASPKAQNALFDGDKAAMDAFLARMATDAAERAKVFGGDRAFYSWILEKADTGQLQAVFAANASLRDEAQKRQSSPAAGIDVRKQLVASFSSAAQAILPLSVFLLLMFILVIREKLPRADEIFLGLFLALFGMTLFNIGIDTGLSKLGGQVGSKLPSAFQSISLSDKKSVLYNFEPAYVQSAVAMDGTKQEFFYAKTGATYTPLPFVKENYNGDLKQYVYTPTRGPLFGGLGGILVLLLFGLLLGYGATLAEPALSALGTTVEELSVGTFKKALLIQAVAIGVGIGIAWGVAKIVWDLPIIWLLVPPYALCLILTWFSSEDYVNIGWDSAGVTTGPITVPLVLAMGLGISGQVGVTEGFGILALASVYPILSVLIVGLVVTAKRKAALNDAGREE